ncbi:MAG: hypothetical protein ACKN9F_06035, partial [Methylomonas sp.]
FLFETSQAANIKVLIRQHKECKRAINAGRIEQALCITKEQERNNLVYSQHTDFLNSEQSPLITSEPVQSFANSLAPTR